LLCANEAVQLYMKYSEIDRLGQPAGDTALVYRESEVAEALKYLNERSAVHRTSLISTPLPPLTEEIEEAVVITTPEPALETVAPSAEEPSPEPILSPELERF